MTETRTRYGNRKIEIDGVRFDSHSEARRYQELRLLERAGEIRDLVLQPRFELAPAVVLDGRKKPALTYVADFSYYVPKSGCFWRQVVEDVKGYTRKDPVFRIKKHLMKTVLNIDVTEVG